MSIEGQGKASSEYLGPAESLQLMWRGRGKPPVNVERQGKASSEY